MRLKRALRRNSTRTAAIRSKTRRLGEKTLGVIEGAPESDYEWRVNADHGNFWGAGKQPPPGVVTEEAAFNICYERREHQPSNKSGSCG
ncbi:MAG: hypothetical protein WDA27_10775 [Actinomycetota bacterium]